MDEQNNSFQSPVQPQQPTSGSVVQPQQPVYQSPVQPQQPFGAQSQPQTFQPQGFGAQPQQPFGGQPSQPQQPFGGQPTMPPPGYVPNAQPVYGAGSYQPPATTGKATGALICGIAAIAICLLVPFLGAPIGLVLGIVAIVLAGSFIKQFGPFGRAKAGRICGIVGVVLSTISLLLSLVLVTFMAVVGASVFESTDINVEDYLHADIFEEEVIPAPLDSIADEKAVTDLVAVQFDDLAAGEVGTLALIGDIANQGFKEDTGMTFEECGIDPEQYAAAVTEGLSYTIDEAVFYDAQSGYVGVYVTCKDIFEAYSLFYDNMNAFSGSEEAQSMSDEELNARAGEILMDAIEQAPIVEDSNWAVIDVELIDGEWSINQETWEFELDYMFSLV